MNDQTKVSLHLAYASDELDAARRLLRSDSALVPLLSKMSLLLFRIAKEIAALENEQEVAK